LEDQKISVARSRPPGKQQPLFQQQQQPPPSQHQTTSRTAETEKPKATPRLVESDAVKFQQLEILTDSLVPFFRTILMPRALKSKVTTQKGSTTEASSAPPLQSNEDFRKKFLGK
jgi:hypothetical protein